MQTINQLPLAARPREKLYSNGVESLSVQELLAVIMRTGCKGSDVTCLAKKVELELQQYGPSATRLQQIRGLGYAKAAEIAAACALGGALRAITTPFLQEPRAIFTQMYDLLEESREHFVAFFLTVRNGQICREVISIGTLTASLVHPREVFKPAILANASKIILAHTHPSGCPKPSSADLDVTSQLYKVGQQLAIEVIDHVICAKDGFVSLKQEYPVLFLDTLPTFC